MSQSLSSRRSLIPNPTAVALDGRDHHPPMPIFPIAEISWLFLLLFFSPRIFLTFSLLFFSLLSRPGHDKLRAALPQCTIYD